MLTGVGPKRAIERDGNVTKLTIIDIQTEGHTLQCALFGPYVDKLNSFLSAGDVSNAVVIVQFGRIKNCQGKVALQNAMYSTKLYFNLDIPIAVDFRNRHMAGDQPLIVCPSHAIVADDFLQCIDRKTIAELKDCTEDCYCIVLGVIKIILDERDWWYPSCKCNRAVKVRMNKGFECEQCKVQMLCVSARYRIKIRVIDDSDSCSMVIFDREASQLLGKSCDDNLKPLLKAGNTDNTPVGRSDLPVQSGGENLWKSKL